MEELVSLFEHRSGIETLSPEQTVTCLSCFMQDEEPWMTARLADISIPHAEQCMKEFWNVFCYRKQVRAHAAG